MSRFVLTAQIALQAPSNTQQVVNQIRRQLQGVSVNINVNANTRQLAQANNQLNSVTRSSTEASRSVSELGRTLGAAARRFGAISIATGTFLALTRSIKNSLGDAIEFERQMVILSQTTGKTVRQLGGLYNEINRLSTSLGVSSDGLVKTAIVLAQAGLEARKTKAALEVLAKTQLAASFDNIVDTTEGAIAILSQFRNEAIQAGGDIKFLEQSLEAINQVSKRFAVESSDLIAVIRRSGGAFEAAGGSLNELLALFTSVRATTRESAETISTGLRTIFTRIQRTDTIKALQELGITLQDVEGKFVGPYEAVRRISEGLASLDPRDFRFAAIVEELGGFRQIGKVIPLIKQFTVAQDALNTAQSSSGSLTQDVTTAQQAMANQIARVREEFQALIRKFSDSESFRSVVGGALEFAKALIKVADAIEPMLPMIAGLAAVQIGRGLVPAVGALAGVGRRRNQGGPIRAFATGGLVPGVGNRDTVPAMLSPGEFVIRKSSVNKIGAANLAHMNSGGAVQHFDNGTSGTGAKKKKKPGMAIDPRPLDQILEDDYNKLTPKNKAMFDEANKNFANTFTMPSALVPGAGFKKESASFASVEKYLGKKDAKKKNIEQKKRIKEEKERRMKEYAERIASNMAKGEEKDIYTPYNPDLLYEMNKGNGKRKAKHVQKLTDALSKKVSQDEDVKEFASGGLASKDTVGAVTLDSAVDKRLRDIDIVIEESFVRSKDRKQNKDIDSIFGGPINKGMETPNTGRTLDKESQTLNRIKHYRVLKSGIKDDVVKNVLDKNINAGLISTVNRTSAALGDKLNIPTPKVEKGERASFIQALGQGVRGSLFEAVLGNLQKGGGSKYNASTEDRQAPFDFVGEGGLQVAPDIFKGQGYKQAYIDSRVSAQSITPKAFKKKIGNQLIKEAPKTIAAKQKEESLATDLKRKLSGRIIKDQNELKSIFTELDIPKPKNISWQGFQDELKQKYRIKSARKTETVETKDRHGKPMRIKKDYLEFAAFAKGGAASDTVPAMLTPGEFVVNRSSAQRIGYGALNRMNKTGVAGFANGGVVGNVMRFNDGTTGNGVPDFTRARASLAIDPNTQKGFIELQSALKEMGLDATTTSQVIDSFHQNMKAGAETIRSMNAALAQYRVNLTVSAKDTQQAATNLVAAPNSKESGNGTSDLTKVVTENTKVQQEANKEIKNSDEKKRKCTKICGCVKICGPKEAGTALQPKTTTTAPTTGQAGSESTERQTNIGASIQAIAQSAQQFIFLASAVSAVGVQFLGLNDATSQAITETIAFGATAIGVAGTILDLGTTALRPLAPALMGLVGSTGLASTALTLLTGPVGIIIGLLALLGAGIAGYIYYQKAYAKAEAEKIQKSNDALAEDIKSGKASIASKEKFVQQEVAASKTLIDSYGIFSGVAEEQKKIQLAATARIASAYMDSIIAVRQFDENMQKIDADKIMTPFQKAGAGILAFADSAAKARASLQTAIAERERMISQQAAKSGVDRSKITEDSFADPDQKRAFKQANETVTNNIDFLSNTFKETTSRFQTQLEESFKNTNFSKATKDMNADGMINAMDAVMEQNAGLAESLAETKRQILLNAEALAANTTDPKAQAEIMHKANMQVYDLGVSFEKQTFAAAKAAHSGELLAKAMADTRNSVLIFKDINNFLGRQAKQTEKFTNLLTQSANIMQSELGDFSLPEIPGLADLKDVKDINEFKNKLGGLAGILGTQGKEIEKVLSATAESFQVVEQSLINVPDLAKIQAPGGGLNTVAENAINAALAPLNKLPPSFQAFAAGIKASLRSAVEFDSPDKGTITEEEARNAYEPLMGAIKSYNEVLSKLVEVASGQLQAYSQHLNQLRSAFQEEINSRQQMVDIMVRGQERIAEALGKPMSIAQKEAARQQKRQIGITAVGGKMKATDVGGIGKALGAAQRQRTVNARQIEDLRTKPSEENIKKLKLLADEENKLALKTKQYRDVLEDLSDQSERAADVLGEIDKEKAKRETGTKILEDFITGGLSEQADILKNFTGIQVAAQTGTLQNFDTETKKSVMGLLSQLGSVDEGFENFRKQLIYFDAIRAGVDPRMAQTLASATPKEEKLLTELQDINLQEMQASEALRKANADNMTELQKNTNTMGQLINELAKNTQAQIAQAQNKIVQTEQQRQQEAARNKQQDILKQQAATNQQRMEQAKRAEAERRSKAGLGLASGGLIYAADGAPIFKPKGTDTVPAMLTPGEFVIQKSAVDQYGTGFMEAVNAGTFAKGGVVYAADGSAINKKKKRKQDKNRQVAADFGTLVDPKDPEISLYGSTGGVVYAADGAKIPQDIWAGVDAATKNLDNQARGIKPRQKVPAPLTQFEIEQKAGQVAYTPSGQPITKESYNKTNTQSTQQIGQQKAAQARGAEAKQQRIQQRQQKMAQAQQQAAYRRLPRAAKIQMQQEQQQQQNAAKQQAYMAYHAQNQQGAMAQYQQQQVQSQQQLGAQVASWNQREAGRQQAWQLENSQRSAEEQQKNIEFQRNQAWYRKEQTMGQAAQPWAKKSDPNKVLKPGETIIEAQTRLSRENIARQNQLNRQKSTLNTQATYGTGSMFNAPTWMSNVMRNAYWTGGIKSTQYSGPIGPNLEQENKRAKGQYKNLRNYEPGYYQPMSSGGIVYASKGASIFKPRGTDTVPAMLTPGEFVMQKSAVDQYGAGFMNSVNNGQAMGYNTGGIVYRDGGGGVLGQIAGGAMKAIGIDPTSVQNLTGTLTQTFDKFIGNVPSAFAPLVDGLNNFINKMANFVGLKLDMNVNVDGALNIQGINSQQIAMGVTKEVTDMVTKEVQRQLAEQKDFRTA